MSTNHHDIIPLTLPTLNNDFSTQSFDPISSRRTKVPKSTPYHNFQNQPHFTFAFGQLSTENIILFEFERVVLRPKRAEKKSTGTLDKKYMGWIILMLSHIVECCMILAACIRCHKKG